MSHQSPSKRKARQKFLALVAPSPRSISSIERKRWIESVCASFVATSGANREYYRVLLETLWPIDSGVPGPHIKTDALRSAIDEYRRRKHDYSKGEYKPYVDVFRRMRELQGEEGLTGVAREGNVFQLVDLKIGPKRVPRMKLSDADWQMVLAKYKNMCPVCKRQEPEVKFDQDHKVPRVRGGSDVIENWQPLCVECNNIKSMACRGCLLNCQTCGWAFPEKYAPLKVSPQISRDLFLIAKRRNQSVEVALKTIISDVKRKYKID